MLFKDFTPKPATGDMATLQLDLPWVQATEQDLGGLLLRRGRSNILTYDDGITLDVRVLEPRRFESVDDLIEATRDTRPGQVTLVAGSVPLHWRGPLRSAEASFADISGVAEINWPRIHVRADRLGQPVTRRRKPLPLQKGNALVVQATLIDALAGLRPTIGEIAETTHVSTSTVSRTIDQLVTYGLVVKERHRNAVHVSVDDPVELANLLVERTAWTRGNVLHAYIWGRSVWDHASRVSERAEQKRVELAVSGRVGSAFLGVVGTSSPNKMRCWVSGQSPLVETAQQLKLEPAPPDEANIELAEDKWRVGLHGADYGQFENWRARIAHPIRVWCDLHAEPRGAEFADQLWSKLAHRT